MSNKPIFRLIKLKGIKDLGDGHALRVATQIVASGQCTEVEEKRNDPKYKSFKVLILKKKVFVFSHFLMFCNIFVLI